MEEEQREWRGRRGAVFGWRNLKSKKAAWHLLLAFESQIRKRLSRVFIFELGVHGNLIDQPSLNLIAARFHVQCWVFSCLSHMALLTLLLGPLRDCGSTLCRCAECRNFPVKKLSHPPLLPSSPPRCTSHVGKFIIKMQEPLNVPFISLFGAGYRGVLTELHGDVLAF